jgi:hypothetical protein
VGGTDLNNPRMRAALAAVLALAPSPLGFTVSQFRARALAMTGHSDPDYSPRHAAYDLKKLRGTQLIAKMGRSRRYELCSANMRSIAALETLRDHVIRPVLAGVSTAYPKPAPIPTPRPTLRTPMLGHPASLPETWHRRLSINNTVVDLSS